MNTKKTSWKNNFKWENIQEKYTSDEMVCIYKLLVAGLPSCFSVVHHRFLSQNYLGTRGLLYYRLHVMARQYFFRF